MVQSVTGRVLQLKVEIYSVLSFVNVVKLQITVPLWQLTDRVWGAPTETFNTVGINLFWTVGHHAP